MTTRWQDLAVAERERQFNPRVAVGHDRVEAYLAEYAERSAAMRPNWPATFDIRYGEGPKATFDIFLPAAGTPAVPFVFIHGGYWRALDKHEHHFVVEPALQAGFAAVVVNYDLCPANTLDGIVAQMRACMAFLAGEGAGLGLAVDAVHLAGHSAGAHLAAMLLHDAGADLAIASAVLASGIYEPAVILELTINADVRLMPDMAARNDALRLPPRPGPVIDVTVGAEEPSGWIAQSRAYAERYAEGRFEAVAGADHFSLLFQPLLPPQRWSVVAP
ncbi:MAG: alpha/beta hydrolase [Geminicoccaceae bacterium]|nr:MAG: alpha/beta hydrolase [Geminicoccaceae bacterium]